MGNVNSMLSDHEAGLHSTSSYAAHKEDDSQESVAGEDWVSDTTLNIGIGLSVGVQFILLTSKLILRGAINDAKHESHDTMLVVDTFMYATAIIRNIFLIHYVRTQVPEHVLHPEQFSLPVVLTEAIWGPSAELLLELTLGAIIGVSLEIVAYELSFSVLGPALLDYIAQAVNFAVLFLLILIVERGWSHLRGLCRWQQLIQVLLIIYDIVLHTITMSKPGVNHDFRDLRMASLASLIAVRLVSFRFFSFKAHHPKLSYVSPLHAQLGVFERPEGAPLSLAAGGPMGREFGEAVAVRINST